MKILIISSRLPHSQAMSGHIIVHERVKRLAARGHEVGLVVFDEADDAAHVAEVRSSVNELEIVPRPKAKNTARQMRDYLLSSLPPRFSAYHSHAMQIRVGAMVERNRYDVALAEFELMGQYLYRNPYLSAIRRVISVHHCHTIARQKAIKTLGLSPRALREWIAMKGLQRYEFGMYHSADRILALTQEERYAMLNYAPSLQIAVIPSGVDTHFFQPDDSVVKEQSIVFTGYYNDEPNQDAVMWFVHTVWPLLKKKYPDLLFYAVGAEPTREMLDLARRDPRIRITGEVADIRPYLMRARLFVSPTRIGSGMRGKLLQAMASGLPVVSTTLSAAGIPIQMGESGFLADKPDIMARYIDLLLSDEPLRNSMGRRARELTVERFAWDRGIDLLEAVLRDVVTVP